MPKASNGEGSDYMNPESSVEKADHNRDPGVNPQTSLYPFWANPTDSPLTLPIPASRTAEWVGESEE